MGKTQLQYGAYGDDVFDLQVLLKKQGYNLKLDGSYGKSFGETVRDAVKDYQQKNGLTVDGIVGDETWASLLGDSSTDNSTPTAAPTIAPAPTAPSYVNTDWSDTKEGKDAWNAYNDALNAVNSLEDFKYVNQKQLDDIMQNILSRKEFSYNFNEDAFYQMHKDKFTKQGKMAMADVMGQAAAMTGGYGNSYAATVGNQAYQASLENLNDILPELYQMAYDRYNQEGQDLYNKYGLLISDYENAYGEHQDKYNKLMDALGIARSDYYDGADLHYTEQNNQNNWSSQAFSDAMDIWEANNTIVKEGVGDGEPPKGEDPPLKAVDSQGVKDFKASIKTEHEFSRGGNDKKTYGDYAAYVEGKLDEWHQAGKIDDNELATLIAYYGFLS